MSESQPASPAKPSQGALPPGLLLYQLATAHYISRALHVAVKLGIADRLQDGPCTFRDLAAESKTDAPSLNRLLRLLASVGVFEELAGGRFALLPLGELLRTDVPGSMNAMVTLFAGDGVQGYWGDLEHCVRTGEPAFRKDDPEADTFAQIAKDPQMAASFDKAMATFAPQTAAALARAYDFSSFGTLADIGGGTGVLLAGILKANPTLRGIVFDLPHVAERAEPQVREAGLADRCQVIPGSFFDGVPSGADAYLLKHVIHDWNDLKAEEILRNCREAMPDGGKLLIVEGIYPDRIDQSLESRSAASNDVNMLVCTGGRQRSETEFRRLFSSAGFRLTRIVPTAVRVKVIEGEKA